MNNIVAPGLHLLIDFWGAKELTNQPLIERTLRKAAEDCGATVLNVMLHSFGENAGITGVAILAESHISIHTWPETGYAAIDIFMCGSCDPHKAILALKETFLPEKEKITDFKRGDS